MLPVGEDGSIIEKLREMLEEYVLKTEPEYYPPVENLLDLIYEHYTENNPAAPSVTDGVFCREIDGAFCRRNQG